MKEKSIRIVNILKGRIAEELVRMLLEEDGFQIYRAGMEHTFPVYTKLLPNEYDELEMWIRRIPDFLAIKDGKSCFVEVKYLTKFHDDFYKRFDTYPDYPNVYIVVVTPHEIDCRTVSDLKNRVRFENLEYLFRENFESFKEDSGLEDIDHDVNKHDMDDVLKKYKESLNRLNSLLGIDMEKIKTFHGYFISTARELLNAVDYEQQVMLKT